MAISIKRVAFVSAVSAGLAACGGGGSDTAAPPPPVVVVPPVAAPIEDSFGAGFGMRFRVGMNTDATDPVPGDLGPISFTTEATTI